MIEYIDLNDFTCFDENELIFCSGINVLIGKNGTGKTHIMKCLAASLKANEDFKMATSQTKDRYGEIVTDRLMSYFKPDSLGRLVKKHKGAAYVRMKVNNEILSFSFSDAMKLVKTENNRYFNLPSSLYIPPREMFSLYEGFLSLYEKREVSFDGTYVELARALNAPLLKGESYQKVKKRLLDPLLNYWDVDVFKKNNRFYIKDETGEYEAHLVAEGLRKIASLICLVSNEELVPDSILFIDEPESNLNPSLISIVTKFLLLLANNGVQIFLATHDYLLTHQLSLNAEYRGFKEHVPEMKFFSLDKSGGSVVIEEGDSLSDIQNNSILDEYAGFYDMEKAYFERYDSK
ncbi:MAG: AAA family ATPase [Tannerellaceae bacterium]|jgi:predicted ATP-dependent endonuclease of OLD family|nr:AAA family ATPase [Tannerellaceae bacterium]